MLYNFPGVGLFAVGLIDEKLRCRTEGSTVPVFLQSSDIPWVGNCQRQTLRQCGLKGLPAQS